MSVMTVNSIVHVFWESECIILSFSKEPKELPRVAEKTCKVWFLVHCIAIIYMDLMSLLLCAWALLSCRFLCPGDAYIYSFLFHFTNWRWDYMLEGLCYCWDYICSRNFAFLTGTVITWNEHLWWCIGHRVPFYTNHVTRHNLPSDERYALVKTLHRFSYMAHWIGESGW